MIFAAYTLKKIGAKNILIKGGHLKSKNMQASYDKTAHKHVH